MTKAPSALECSSVLEFAGSIKDALGDPLVDVPREVAAGNIRLVTGTAPPGYTALLSVAPDILIAINSELRHRYKAYADVLAVIMAERAAARTNLFHVLDVIRSHVAIEALSEKKIAGMNPTQAYGHVMIARPYMGQYFQIRGDMCIPFHHFVLQRLLRERLSADLTVVFEIGSGAGDSLVELAATNPYPHIQFFGGEIARVGHKCLAALGELSGLSNVHSVDFDITSPDFGFLKGARRIMVFSQFALVYPALFPEDFFDRLLDAVEEVECVLFEPLSFALAKELQITPLFDEQRARSYAVTARPWECIQRLARAGKIVIEEIIPDIVGKTALSSVSLVRFRKA